MKETEKSLSYDMTGYDHRSVCKMLVRNTSRQFGWHPKLVYIPLIAAYAIMIVGAAKFGWRGSPWLPYGALIVAVALNLALARRRSALLWGRISASPLRTGPTRLSLTDSGIALDTPSGHSLLHWSCVQDIKTSRSGLLVQVADLDYIAIPASAFSGMDSQEAFRADLVSRAAQAKEAVR